MSEFVLNGKIYHTPLELALDRLGGKWKLLILWKLNQQSYRYGELQREVTGISHKVFSQQLKELEADGLITREMHAVIPPRVEYTITRVGRATLPIIDGMRKMGQYFRKHHS